MKTMTRPAVFFLLMSLVISTHALAKGNDDLAAKVDGEPITLVAVDEAAKSDLMEVMVGMYKIRKSHLDAMIADKLFNKEAEALGKTSEALHKEMFMDARLSVTDETVKQFYEANRFRFPDKSFEAVREDIRQVLVDREMIQRQSAYVSQLQKKYPVEIFLNEPKIEIDIAGQPSRGPEDAPITFVEFSDFQCPYCVRFRETTDRLFKDYEGKIRQVFRHNPLPFHDQARDAHHAAVCAHKQGKFWEYRDVLFDHPKALSPSSLRAYGELVGLDLDQFDQCVADDEVDAQLDRDLEYAHSVGAQGTPTSFINGTLFAGAQPYEDLKKIIDEKLGA